jgi:hypothetical protein
MEVVSFGQILNAFGDPIVCVGFHWFLVMARENPFRFEMMYRTRENPTTVNRVQQPAASLQDFY